MYIEKLRYPLHYGGNIINQEAAMKRVLLFAAMFMFVMSGVAFAEIGAGTKEVSVMMDWNNIETEADGGGKSEVTEMDLQLLGGFFVIDPLEVGGILDYSSSEVKGGEDTSTWALTGFGKFHILGVSDQVVPYVGAQAGYFSMESGSNHEETGFIVGALGGAKFLVSNDFSVNAELQYNISLGAESKEGSNSTDIDISQLRFLVGMSYLF